MYVLNSTDDLIGKMHTGIKSLTQTRAARLVERITVLTVTFVRPDSVTAFLQFSSADLTFAGQCAFIGICEQADVGTSFSRNAF